MTVMSVSVEVCTRVTGRGTEPAMLPFESCSLNTVLLLGLVLVLLHRYLTSRNGFWKDRGIVFKPPVVFFGNFKDFILVKKSYGKINKDIYNEFKNEPFVGIFKSRSPELLVRDPDLIKNILVKDFRHFQDRNTDINKHEKLSENLFTVNGLQWKLMRQKFTPIFTSGKLKNMFHLVLEKGEEFQKYLEVSVNLQEDQNVHDLLSRFTIDVIGSCGFGVVMNSMTDSETQFRKMGYKIFEATFKKSLKVFSFILSPELYNYFKVSLGDVDVHNFFISTVKEIVEQRKESNEKRHDFIDLLLELKNKGAIQSGEDEIEFDDVFMAAQAFIFFAAGFETSSTLMSFILCELALHPDIQDKVFMEIEEVLSKHNGKLTYDSIIEMHYLDMVLSEGLRKYPALGALVRKCVIPYQIPGTNITIDRDTTISIPVLGIHYDPEFYPEPHKFIPERFTAEAKQARHPMTYLPFGEGPRNCIGMRFGKMQSMVGIVSFLQKYKVTPSARTEKKIVINPGSFVTTAKNGFWLKIVPRSNNYSK